MGLINYILPFIILNIAYFIYKVRVGLVTGIFLINYAIVRIMIEFIREPDIQVGLFFSYFTIAQILSIPILILGLAITSQCLYKTK